jgi:hypothetical protein
VASVTIAALETVAAFAVAMGAAGNEAGAEPPPPHADVATTAARRNSTIGARLNLNTLSIIEHFCDLR